MVLREFDHQRLRMYQLALDFNEFASELNETVRRRSPALADQLHRAAISIALNIAEGAGEFRSAEKVRFYRMAQRSATECAAALDLLVRTRLETGPRVMAGQELLKEIVAMLVGTCRRREAAMNSPKSTP